MFGAESVGPLDADLTKNGVKNGEALGERIVMSGQVTTADGTPQPNTLIEIWQANAAGRYVDPNDDHPAPLDPNFLGAGRCVTDAEGRYRFYTIKPGAYPFFAQWMKGCGGSRKLLLNKNIYMSAYQHH